MALVCEETLAMLLMSSITCWALSVARAVLAIMATAADLMKCFLRGFGAGKVRIQSARDDDKGTLVDL